MTITEVRIYLSDEEKVKAYVTAVIENALVIHDMKIIARGPELFLAMPSRKMKDGKFKDIAHPIKAEIRAAFEKTILDAYLAKLASSNIPAQS